MSTRNKPRARHKHEFLPSGSRIMVQPDVGAPYETVTRSLPWPLGSGDWVVLLKGRAGGYSLDRVVQVLDHPAEGAEA